ncbi:hypothetical protein R1sor_019157 [Riccia sorocarpa]|uniref:Uncharacterized protein n=1 Tax=Riccia sorocarpa TaxID=122646 RepID=A0ABD3IFI1_9MARC
MIQSGYRFLFQSVGLPVPVRRSTFAGKPSYPFRRVACDRQWSPLKAAFGQHSGSRNCEFAPGPLELSFCIAFVRRISSVLTFRKGFVLFAMAESAMATAESKVISVKEAKAWLQSKSAGGYRVVSQARMAAMPVGSNPAVAVYECG